MQGLSEPTTPPTVSRAHHRLMKDCEMIDSKNRIKGHLRIALISCSAGLLLACSAFTPDPGPASNEANYIVSGVVTREQQQAMTPDSVLSLLQAGNKRFVEGTLTQRDHSKKVRAAVDGQFPKAVVLSCIDSRVPVEDVFDRGIGDMFVARVAGNFVNSDILGSIEFGTKVAGAKLVVVMGHEQCGAVKGAIDGVELGNITPMLVNIQPAVDHFDSYEGEQSSQNEEFVHMVIEQNVRMTADRIRKESPILSDLENSGEIKIVGAVYNMGTGEVRILEL